MCFFSKLKDKLIEIFSGSKENSNGSDTSNSSIEIECNYLCNQLTSAIEEANKYISNNNQFVDKIHIKNWKNKNYELNLKMLTLRLKDFKKARRYKELDSKVKSFVSIWDSIDRIVSKHNENWAKEQLSRTYGLIGLVEGKKLDEQQMMAIVKPSINNLILSGAGTGKTTTINGKIKYLLINGEIKPEEILVLSFTKDSASEMSDRIKREFGYPITVSTFHKLGLEIIKSVEGIVPKIYSKSVSTFIRSELSELMKDPAYLDELCRYALFYRNNIREESDFSTKEEYEDYLRSNAPTTFKGEVVKSYGEMDIANFLYQNQISYEYETSYKFDTNNESYGQYHPDFYLTEFDIYIEYFGINRKGEVADFFNSTDDKSASEIYREGINWKRKTHKEKHTKMIECYAYEKFENTLLTNLGDKLNQEKVDSKPLSPEELWERINKENSTLLEGIINLFGTVITLAKSNDYTIEDLKEKAIQSKYKNNCLYILSLIKPLFEAYDKMLEESDQIDFNDMINKATKYIREGKYVNQYKYVIVDEYQDISKARFNLLFELRNSSFFNLFCVGDDWQSIYRFAGSDINYIVDFEKYWGPTEVGKIETTYRFKDSLIDVSSRFIMRNPKQIRKNIRGKSHDNSFSIELIEGYTEKNAVQFMIERLNDLPNKSSVFFIGRYSFDIDMIKENAAFEVKYDIVKNETLVKYYKRPDLNIKFLTAHGSKGLQADYVFILNNKDAKMGFPSKMQDDAIIDLLLEKAEVYPYAEERRLFYVAITRARVKVFFLAVEKKNSIFIKELIKIYGKQLKDSAFICPQCGGRLIKKKGSYGDFLGCSNYAKNGCKYTRKINVI